MRSWNLIQFEALDSTNAYACACMADLRDGDVVQAERQIAGRGRLQRAWISHPPDNLYLSLVLKPPAVKIQELPLANLSQWLAVALCRLLDRYGASPAIKWPNDVLARGRKISGILAESVVKGEQFLGMVLGVGVNLNFPPEILAAIDQPATALNQIAGQPVAASAFRDQLLEIFFQGYDKFLATGFSCIREEYLQRALFIGTRVEVRLPSGQKQVGKALDVDVNGALMLAAADGQILSVTIGDIFAL